MKATQADQDHFTRIKDAQAALCDAIDAAIDAGLDVTCCVDTDKTDPHINMETMRGHTCYVERSAAIVCGKYSGR